LAVDLNADAYVSIIWLDVDFLHKLLTNDATNSWLLLLSILVMFPFLWLYMYIIVSNITSQMWRW